MSYFRKRKAQVIGHGTPPEISEKQKKDPNFPPSIFLRFSNASWDADSLFLASMGREAELRREKPETETLFDIAFTANGYAAFDYSLSREENGDRRRKEETAIRERIRNALESGAASENSAALQRKETASLKTCMCWDSFKGLVSPSTCCGNCAGRYRSCG